MERELAEFERLRISLTKAMTILENLFANGQKPALEQAAAARSATEIGLQSIAGFRPDPSSAPDVAASVTAQIAKAYRGAFNDTEATALSGHVAAEGVELPNLDRMRDAPVAGFNVRQRGAQLGQEPVGCQMLDRRYGRVPRGTFFLENLGCTRLHPQRRPANLGASLATAQWQ